MIGKKCGPSEATLKVKDLQRLTVKHFVNAVWTSAWKSNQCTKAIFTAPTHSRSSFLSCRTRACDTFLPFDPCARVPWKTRNTTEDESTSIFFTDKNSDTHLLRQHHFLTYMLIPFVTLRYGPLRKGGVGGGGSDNFQGKNFFQCQIVQECFFLFGSFNIIILFTFSRAIISFLVIAQKYNGSSLRQLDYVWK